MKTGMDLNGWINRAQQHIVERLSETNNPNVMFQVAGGILLAALVIYIMMMGVALANDPKRLNLQSGGVGDLVQGAALIIAIIIIYRGLV